MSEIMARISSTALALIFFLVQVAYGGVLLLNGSNLVRLDVVVNGENIQSLAGDSKTSYCNQYRVISPALSQ